MKILLVEDVRSVAAVMTARLNHFGHEVLYAANGREALDSFRLNNLDLILMDIEMPEMNGFEATNRIRAIEAEQEWAWTPIVFLTASDTINNLITSIEAGGDDFLAKSAPEPVLHAKMKAMARIAALRQRLAIANSKLSEQAHQDGLTGLCNRRSMDLRLDVAWDKTIAEQAPFGLLMLDIDNFKKYNDHYGHPVGDECLRGVAAAIAAVVDQANREGLTREAFAARYGGEEFAVILPGSPDPVVQTVAASIIAAIQGRAIAHARNENWGIVTASIGGACLGTAQGKLANLFRKADENLYRAKESGRNRFVIIN